MKGKTHKSKTDMAAMYRKMHGTVPKKATKKVTKKRKRGY